MKCSECSTVIKPVVAIDLDGTLGDYHGHFLKFAGEYMACHYSPDYRGDVEMHEHMKVTLDVYRQIKLAYRQGGGKRMMPLYPGAGMLLEVLKAAGAEVWITTTRPYNRFDSTDPDTRFWLQRHFLPYDHLLFDDDKYKILAEHVGPERVVAVLDDLPSMLTQAAEQFGMGAPIFRRTRYNDALEWPGPCASHLTSARMMIMERIERWNERNR